MRGALFISIAVLLVVEATLRLLLGLGNPVLIQADPSCGYILKPNQHVRRFFVQTHINAYGMRSSPIGPEKARGAIRLMFLGDSITYGTTQVDQSQIFTERIHTLLSGAIHRQIEVLNASASAWAISNEYEFLKSRGTFQADLLIIVLNSGDLNQSFSDMSKVGEELPYRKPWTAIGEVMSRFVLPKLFSRPAKTDAGTSSKLYQSPTATKNLEDLTEICRLASAQHTRVTLVYIPFRRDLGKLSGSTLPEMLNSWRKTNGIPTIDLTQAEQPYRVEEITLPDRTHFNALGNGVIASVLGPFLLKVLNGTTSNTHES